MTVRYTAFVNAQNRVMQMQSDAASLTNFVEGEELDELFGLLDNLRAELQRLEVIAMS